MSTNDAIAILASLGLSLLMWFAGRASAKREQARKDKEAVEKAGKVDLQVKNMTRDQAKKELDKWGRH